MFTNDIKKGMMVRLRDGRVVEVMDNRRWNVRRVRGEGVHGEEMGDIYSWEFAYVQRDGSWLPVELTPNQVRSMEETRDLFGRPSARPDGEPDPDEDR